MAFYLYLPFALCAPISASLCRAEKPVEPKERFVSTAAPVAVSPSPRGAKPKEVGQ